MNNPILQAAKEKGVKSLKNESDGLDWTGSMHKYWDGFDDPWDVDEDGKEECEQGMSDAGLPKIPQEPNSKPTSSWWGVNEADEIVDKGLVEKNAREYVHEYTQLDPALAQKEMQHASTLLEEEGTAAADTGALPVPQWSSNQPMVGGHHAAQPHQQTYYDEYDTGHDRDGWFHPEHDGGLS